MSLVYAFVAVVVCLNLVLMVSMLALFPASVRAAREWHHDRD